jgi:putative glycosyl hydrolase-like family 6 (GHL6) protein/glycosyl hydrolase family 42 (putative beta-galactosidase)
MSDPASLVWFERPQRLIQTVLRERDVVGYDPDDVIAYLKHAKASGLVINGGGIFDFFQNPLPMANVNVHMGNRDILREISTACREAGFHVIARVDFRGVEETRYAVHPEWFAVGADGGPVVASHNSVPLRVPCYNGFYRNEHAIRFVRHILREYPIDGVWHNSVLIQTRCYCPLCRDSFHRSTGSALDPARETEPEYEKLYRRWQNASARQNLTRIRDAVKEVGTEKAYVAEVFNMFDVERPKLTGVDLYEASDFFDFLVSVGFLTENRPEPQFERLSYPYSLVRFLRSLDARKQPVLLFGSNGTAYRYVSDPPEDLKIWLWETVAAGGGFWNCVFNGMHPGRTHDRRNAFLAAESYEYLCDHESEIRDTLPLADVRVLYSKPTKDHFGSDDPALDRAVHEVRGFERTLISGHVQYGFVADRDLRDGFAVDQRILLLPNVACMSEEQCEAVRRFVERGGTLIASFQTSLYDENGEPREDFGLADVFGIHLEERELDTSFDRYQYVLAPDHDLLRGFRDTEVLAMAGRACRVSAHPDTQVVTSITEQIRNQPPELAWSDDLSAGMPGACTHEYGEGRVVYFAFTIGRLVSLGLHPDYQNLLLSAIRYGSQDGMTVHAEAPSTVHISVLEGPAMLVVNLVNHTVGEQRPVQEVVPVSDIRVTIRRPAVGITQWRVLYGDQSIKVSQAEDILEVVVPHLSAFASVLLKLAPTNR